MSSSIINSVSSVKPYSSLAALENETKDTSIKESHKKKQIVSEREGNYYCTYMVNDKGQKILLARIPVAQADGQKNSRNCMKSDEEKHCEYNAVKNARTAFECKQQAHIELNHKKNVKEIMSILKEYVGIPQKSNKTYDY